MAISALKLNTHKSWDKNIVLTGFMGTGKSAVGKALAKFSGFEFVDTDEIIEKKTGKSISNIFKEDGEKRFREIESEIISEACKGEKQIISTGGGAITSQDNLEKMKSTGSLVALTATPDEIFERVKNETHRPLLNHENPKEKIKELLKKRLPYYLQADLIIDTEGKKPEKIARDIMKLIGGKRSFSRKQW